MTATKKASCRLYLGDCIEIMGQLEDGSYDLVVADPPYGINCSKIGSGIGGKGTYHRYTTTGASRIVGDDLVDVRWLTEAFRLLADGGILYSFSHWKVDRKWHDAIEQVGFKIKNRIVWEKSHGSSGDLDGAFMCKHETIWRAVKGAGAKLRCKRYGDVWRDKRTECIRHHKVHPFEKPVDLLARCILADTDQGANVIDPFMGSGSTGVACTETGRLFTGIEICQEYYEEAECRIRAAVRKPSMYNTLGI